MGANPQVSDVARLAVALVVLPLMWQIARDIRMSGRHRRWLALTLIFVYLSYALAIVEGFGTGPLVDALAHVSRGIAGVFGLMTSMTTRRRVLEERLR